MTAQEVQQLFQYLQDKKLMSSADAHSILEEANTKHTSPFDVLKERGNIEEEILTQSVAEVIHMPYVNLREVQLTQEVMHLLSQDIESNYKVVPFKRVGSDVSVAVVNPYDFKAIEALDFIARRDKLKMTYHLVSESSFREAMKQYGNLGQEVEQALQAQIEGVPDERPSSVEELSGGDSNIANAPISKMVAVILRYAVDGSASDVHIEPEDDATRVRYRVDGVLHTSLKLPKAVHNALVARIKVLANLKLDETRLPQDGRFRMTIDNRSVDFRVSTFPLIGSEKVVLRILDRTVALATLNELGFRSRDTDVITAYTNVPNGMILVTGPTGSGKSTTLYALLQMLNTDERNIVTLEDPIEYYMAGIAQAQVNPDIGFTFAKGLRSILRQDPNVIMVGEIRDQETAELAIHSALTGHLLFSTLHTNDAAGAIPRLIDMGVEPFLISSALSLVIAQRLVRRVCDNCRKQITLPVELESEVLLAVQDVSKDVLPEGVTLNLPLKLYKGDGCQKCEHTGYKGRVAIAELLVVNDTIKEMIVNRTVNSVAMMQQAQKDQTMISLRQDGILKALQGLTTIEEVWQATLEG
ncbi:MAG: GspE/PulE family protein [Candidatus Kerfeldbacteria bacterium]|nr:GspE/PulE family protein [Candidatus Kerfeldbacteria bacterium]